MRRGSLKVWRRLVSLPCWRSRADRRATLAGASQPITGMAPRRATIVLVHGGWPTRRRWGGVIPFSNRRVQR